MFMTPSPQDSKPSVHQVMSATAATEEFSPDELDQALADEVFCSVLLCMLSPCLTPPLLSTFDGF